MSIRRIMIRRGPSLKSKVPRRPVWVHSGTANLGRQSSTRAGQASRLPWHAIGSVPGYLASLRLASQSRDCFSPFRSNSILPLIVSALTFPA